MKAYLIRILLVLIFFSTFSCSEDFDVNADWKDITVVYGLLDPYQKDSIQYIKISKGFTNEGANAHDIAKSNIDSLYYSDSLIVVLEQRKKGNILLPNIPLYKEYNENKDLNGDFYAPGQYIYRTAKGTVLNKNYTYTLSVKNVTTGKTIKSETNMIGDIIQIIPLPTANIHFDTSSDTRFIWKSGTNAYFYNIDLVFKYYQYPLGKPNLREIKEIKWRMSSYYLVPSISSDMEVKVEGKKFFEVVADQIKKEENYKDYQREFPKDNLELVFTGGGKEIYYYIHVNQPSIGLVQKKPEYTNIENGYGVFSCKNTYTFNTQLSSFTKSYMIYSDEMVNYNFIE